MKKLILLLSAVVATLNVSSQDETLKEAASNFEQEKVEKPDSLKNWDVKLLGSVNASQAAFRDWASGGQNSINISGLIDFQALYVKDEFSWRNGINLAYGQTKIQDIPWRKTDDNIEAFSNVGYELIEDKFGLTFITTFRTQFDEGYNFPNDSTLVSNFMAPGYLTANLGFAYSPQKNFQVIFAPVASKMTFVNDQVLANQGAFGVEGAELDAQGNILTPGRRFRAEFGAFVKVLYNMDIMENVSLKTRLELFSNYLNSPQNIDVIGEMILNMKVNKWLTANIAVNMLYDDDININYDSNNDGIKDANGPRLQYKHVISVGLGYTFRNQKPEKKK